MNFLRLNVIVATILLLSPIAVSAYTFQESPAVTDSVRLSLNTGKSVNGTVAIDVLAYQVSNVYAAAFDVDFNSSVLEWAGRFTFDPDGYERGTFLGTSAMYDIGHQIEVNGTVNRNKLVGGAVGNYMNPQTGSGTIITIKFKVVGPGTTAVSFSANNLIRPDMSFTSSSWYGGTFVSDGMVPAPPQDDPPVVSLNTPDQSVFASRNITLTCTASDDYGLANLTLYTNASGSWQPYQTRTLSDNVRTESFSVTNLQEGAYKWNCRAADIIGQEGTGQVEFFFTVQLPADSTPPQRSSGQPSGNLAVTNVTVSLQTNEAATCRYANVPGLDFNSMIYNFTNTGGTAHSVNVSLTTGYLYNYYVRCRDSTGNANANDYLISFSIGAVSSDTQPPVVTNDMVTGLLSWNTGYANLAVRTDEDAICKYASQPGVIFGSMETFANTFFRNHTEIVAGLHEGGQYSYYVKCSDSRGNTNPTDTQVSFYVCCEVDEDCSRVVSLAEMNKFVSRWYMDNRDVPIMKLIQAFSLWKSGHA